jgi:cellulose synthase/poly-beta-1,6-N-acetylglucosamine synthase-like glycosyltransferase
MAHNEEANIGHMLEALCNQRIENTHVAEIVVIASGCVDGTEDIVRQYCARDSRIYLISQAKREGKAAAINTLLSHTDEEIVVVVNADTIPVPEAIESLLMPFQNPEIGMTAGHAVPLNDPSTFMGFAVCFLWALHHQVSLRYPKMGELIAFRNIFQQIPRDSSVDEASIEPLIRGQGLQLCYAPGAVVYNRGPETVSDYLRQRRRIYAGHVYVRDTLGYRVSTMNAPRLLWMLLRNPGVKRDWRYFLWVPIVVALEVYARLLGVYDYKLCKRKHAIWEMVETTKTVIAPSSSAGSGNKTPLPGLSEPT